MLGVVETMREVHSAWGNSFLQTAETLHMYRVSEMATLAKVTVGCASVLTLASFFGLDVKPLVSCVV